jgi:hypothetical protein
LLPIDHRGAGLTSRFPRRDSFKPAFRLIQLIAAIAALVSNNFAGPAAFHAGMIAIVYVTDAAAVRTIDRRRLG